MRSHSSSRSPPGGQSSVRGWYRVLAISSGKTVTPAPAIADCLSGSIGSKSHGLIRSHSPLSHLAASFQKQRQTISLKLDDVMVWIDSLIVPNTIAEKHGIGAVLMIRLLHFDLTFPPQVVDDATEMIAGFPVALHAQVVRLTQHQKVQYVSHVMVLECKRLPC